MCATYPAQLNVLGLFTLAIFREDYKPWSSALYSFLTGPNIPREHPVLILPQYLYELANKSDKLPTIVANELKQAKGTMHMGRVSAIIDQGYFKTVTCQFKSHLLF